MDRHEGGELADITASLERGDWEVWEKVAALDGSEFDITFCCNSEKLQRTKVVQISGRSSEIPKLVRHPEKVIDGMSGERFGKSDSEIPIEIQQILTACRTNDKLRKQVAAYNRSRFDLVFKFGSHFLIDWGIGDS